MKIPVTKVFPFLLSFQNENNTGSVKVKAAWDGLGLAQVNTRVSLPGGHAWSQQGSGSACGGRVTGSHASVHCVLGAVLNVGCCCWWGLLADGQYGVCSLVDRLIEKF